MIEQYCGVGWVRVYGMKSMETSHMSIVTPHRSLLGSPEGNTKG